MSNRNELKWVNSVAPEAPNKVPAWNGSGNPVVIDPLTGDGADIAVTARGIWEYQSLTTTPVADGKVRFDSTTIGSITEMRIAQTTDEGVDAGYLFNTLKAGDDIYFQLRADATKWVRFKIATAPVDNGAWWTMPVTVVASGGVLPGSATKCIVRFTAGTIAYNYFKGSYASLGALNTAVPTAAAGDYALVDVAASPAQMYIWDATDSLWRAAGGISLAAVGSVPNVNAATLTGSVLNLEPASFTAPGIVTTGTQTFGGGKTFGNGISVTGLVLSKVLIAGGVGAVMTDNDLHFDTTFKNLGIGVGGSPFAHVHIAGGTASSFSAPLKINSGTAMTTPENGAMEYHGSHLWFTIGTTRYQLDQQPGVPGGSTGELQYNNGGVFAGSLIVTGGGAAGMIMGTASTLGASRTLSTSGSATDVGLNINLKGLASTLTMNIGGFPAIVSSKADATIYCTNSFSIREENDVNKSHAYIDIPNRKISFGPLTGPGIVEPWTIQGASGSTTFPGGMPLTIAGGDGYTVSGDWNGGDLILKAGQRRVAGAGIDGNITIDSLLGDLNIGLGTGKIKITLPGGTNNTGDMYYRNSSGYLTRVGVGTNGWVLTLSGGLPVWAVASGGGGVTLSAIGSTPNANAATLTGSVLNLEPASGSFGGIVTTAAQTFAGRKTFTPTATIAGVNIGSVATNPSTLVNGDLWMNSAVPGTTAAGFAFYIGGTFRYAAATNFTNTFSGLQTFGGVIGNAPILANASTGSYAAVNALKLQGFHGASADGDGLGPAILFMGHDNQTLGRITVVRELDGTSGAMEIWTPLTGALTARMNISHTGNVGIGLATRTYGTARLHLAAGTAAVNTAPFKLTTGTALATPEDGAVEYHSSHLYFTVGSTRYQLDNAIVTADNGLTKTGTNVQLGGVLTANTNVTSTGGVFGIQFGTAANPLDSFQTNVDTSITIQRAVASDSSAISLTATIASLAFGTAAVGATFQGSATGILLDTFAADVQIQTRSSGKITLQSIGLINFNPTGVFQLKGVTASTPTTMFFRGDGTWAIPAGGGGITNTAAADELMKSDNTNAIPSGLFATTNGSVILGSTAIAGNRTITTESSTADATLTISSKGNGNAVLTSGSGGNIYLGSTTGNGIRFDVVNGRLMSSSAGLRIECASASSRMLLQGGSYLQVAGMGFVMPITTSALSLNTTLDDTYFTVLVDASSSSKTMTLPTATTVAGRIYIIKKVDASANTVVIDANASELIDGAATLTISTQYAGYVIQSNGTGWNKIGAF